jgi:hypothetical protein
MTDFTLAPEPGPSNGWRKGSKGFANQAGGGVEIEYEGRTRRAWLASFGYTKGSMYARQYPELSPNHKHNFTQFTTNAIVVGRRRYFRSLEAPLRAYVDGSVGYEWLSADLNYFVFPTDTLVRTAGPTGRVRFGTQWRWKERISSEISLQGRFAYFGDWTRSGRTIPGKPAKLTSYSLNTAIRMRM